MLARIRTVAMLSACATVLAVTLTSCAGSDADTPSTETGANPPRTPVARRAIIVDTDLGADDVIALAMLLRHPRVDVRAVTVSGTGLVHCPLGVQHVRSLLLDLGVQDRPVGCGRTDPGGDGRAFPAAWRSSSDSLYGLQLPTAMVGGEGEDAVAVMNTAVTSPGRKVSIVALGPWTNLEDLFARHPETVDRVARIHAMAGAIGVTGNATSGAEWNVRADPSAFDAVLRTELPVTLVPLNATNAVPLSPEFFDSLSANPSAPAADLAWRLLDRNRFLLTAGQYLWDELAAIAFVEPAVVRVERVRVQVEAAGGGAGRIFRSESGREIDAALGADGGRAVEAILAALRES